MSTIIGVGGSILIGAVVAVVTVVGIVSNSVDSSADKPGDVNHASIQYGTN